MECPRFYTFTLFILTFAHFSKPTPISQPSEDAVNKTSDHGDPSLVCTPTNWYEILLFYAANYLAHAATYKPLPGQRYNDIILETIWSLLFPFTSIVQAVREISKFPIKKHPIFGGSDIEMAARAGALCVVARESLDAVAGEEHGKIIRGVEVRARKPQQDVAASASEQSDNIGLEEQHIQRQQKAVWKMTVFFANELHGMADMPEPLSIAGRPNEFRRNVQGRPNLPIGYTLMPLPSNAVVHAHTPRNLSEETRKLQLASSYSFSRTIIALVQTIYGVVTLYRTRGNQISHYGYAAFGLTVLPYVIMSLVNLLASLASPDYPVMYMVHSAEMDEACGGDFEGVVGQVEHPKFDESHSKFSFTTTDVRGQYLAHRLSPPSVHQNSTANAVPEQDIAAVPENVETGDKCVDQEAATTNEQQSNTWIVSNAAEHQKVATHLISIPHKTSVKTLRSSRRFGLKRLVYLGLTALPFAVIGGLTAFSEGHSTRAQRAWTMSWLVFGIVFGFNLRMMRKLDDPKMRSSPWADSLVHIFKSLVYAIPAIGGFVVVGQMLLAWGYCTERPG